MSTPSAPRPDDADLASLLGAVRHRIARLFRSFKVPPSDAPALLQDALLALVGSVEFGRGAGSLAQSASSATAATPICGGNGTRSGNCPLIRRSSRRFCRMAPTDIPRLDQEARRRQACPNLTGAPAATPSPEVRSRHVVQGGRPLRGVPARFRSTQALGIDPAPEEDRKAPAGGSPSGRIELRVPSRYVLTSLQPFPKSL